MWDLANKHISFFLSFFDQWRKFGKVGVHDDNDDDVNNDVFNDTFALTTIKIKNNA